MATRPRPKRSQPRKRAAAKPRTQKAKAPVKKPRAPRSPAPLDLTRFPQESIVAETRTLCLKCVWEVFTRHLNLAPRTALLEIQRYAPSLDELTAPAPARPYFVPQPPNPHCPYCGSPAKWHARMRSYRIESGKATDPLRRRLVKSLPKSGHQFAVLEQKATQQHAFFEWLEKVSEGLDLDDPAWLREVSLHYLGRKEPRIDWRDPFAQTGSIRRSRRLETGWEMDSGRLFLAPVLFDELLLVHYLVSRSHRAGGLTLEGRYTLPELWRRLRNSGYLLAVGIEAGNPSDALEQLLAYLGGGEASVRFYYILDRREFLQAARQLKITKA
jgi:hypothetical protein